MSTSSYVRDFPVLIAAALAQVPPLGDVRGALAENLYEEQTGGSRGRRRIRSSFSG